MVSFLGVKKSHISLTGIFNTPCKILNGRFLTHPVSVSEKTHLQEMWYQHISLNLWYTIKNEDFK